MLNNESCYYSTIIVLYKNPEYHVTIQLLFDLNKIYFMNKDIFKWYFVIRIGNQLYIPSYHSGDEFANAPIAWFNEIT